MDYLDGLIGIVPKVWPAMIRRWFGLNHTWPIRIKILQMPTATFRYPQRRCYVEVEVEFHLRKQIVILKDIQLRLKGKPDIQQAMSFYLRKDYEELNTTDIKREEEFIYDDFSEDMEGYFIIKADDDECRSKCFPIKLTNKKDDLPPLDSIKPRIFKL